MSRDLVSHMLCGYDVSGRDSPLVGRLLRTTLLLSIGMYGNAIAELCSYLDDYGQVVPSGCTR